MTIQGPGPQAATPGQPTSFRHHEVTRIEGFSDAVFGFALTLLVVSLDVPKSFAELRSLVGGFWPFALMFAMVCYIWWEHNKFFRRHGLQDAFTAFLNCVLLFVVLFYVYPLKFLTLSLVGQGSDVLDTGISGDLRFLMLTYSTGVLLVFGTLALLYVHGWRQRHALGLGPAEVITARFGLQAQLISASLAAISIVLAMMLREELMWVPGVLYGLMGPLHGMNGYFAGAAHEKLKTVASAG